MAKKNKQEPPVIQYRGRYICRVADTYRIKLNPSDHFAIHRGSFNSVDNAMDYLDFAIHYGSFNSVDNAMDYLDFAIHYGSFNSVDNAMDYLDDADDRAGDQSISHLEQEVESLRAQVEELSKYPEEAVRAVFDMGVTAGMSSAKHAIDPAQNYGKLKDKISAIFKEKQGEGK